MDVSSLLGKGHVLLPKQTGMMLKTVIIDTLTSVFFML